MGILLYLLGVIVVNTFFSPQNLFGSLSASFLNIAAVGITVFFLSSFFYGKIAFITLFFAGAFLGSNIVEEPLVVVVAMVPLLISMLAGIEIGKAALSDFKGKSNFFEKAKRHVLMAGIAVVFSLAISYVLSGVTLAQLFPNGFEFDLIGYIEGLSQDVRLQ